MLKPDAQPDERVGRAGRPLGGVLRAALHHRLNAPEARRGDDQRDARADGVGIGSVAVRLERDHRAAAAHLAAHQVARRVDARPRVANPGDRGVVDEPVRQLRGGGLSPLDAHRQRPQVPEREERLQRPGVAPDEYRRRRSRSTHAEIGGDRDAQSRSE